MEVGRRFFGKGADLIADVAARSHVAQWNFETLRNWSPVFDGDIGDTPAGIEQARFREGIGRAGVQADRASAAMFRCGGIRLQFDIGQQEAEKELGSQPTVDQHGVLADPTQACPSGPLSFEGGGGVDTGSPSCTRVVFGQAATEPDQFLLEDAVVIAAPGVSGDPDGAGVGR